MFQKLDIEKIASSKIEIVACRVFLGKKDTIVIANVYNPDGNEPQTDYIFNKMKKVIKD